MKRIVHLFLLFPPLCMLAQSYVAPPYFTGFESGLDAYWTVSTTSANSEVYVNADQTPYAGSYHLSFVGTQWWPEVNSLNSASLHLDLDSAVDVTIDFYMEDYLEENHAENGVFFSDDGGYSFTKVMDYNGASYTDDTYYLFSLDVTSLASSYGLDLTSTFIIRFQQYGYEPVPSDGISIDNVSVNQVSALPVEWLHFMAVKDGTFVALSWQTASETNNAGFSVQRSKDALRWEELMVVEGAGNASTPQQYAVMDEKPYAGISYYRVKQYDFNGAFTNSKTTWIDMDMLMNSSIHIYPNPTNNSIGIEGSSYELEEIRLFNALGLDVSDAFEIVRHQKTIAIVDLSALPSGVYVLKTKMSTRKVLKH